MVQIDLQLDYDDFQQKKKNFPIQHIIHNIYHPLPCTDKTTDVSIPYPISNTQLPEGITLLQEDGAVTEVTEEADRCVEEGEISGRVTTEGEDGDSGKGKPLEILDQTKI